MSNEFGDIYIDREFAPDTIEMVELESWPLRMYAISSGRRRPLQVLELRLVDGTQPIEWEIGASLAGTITMRKMSKIGGQSLSTSGDEPLTAFSESLYQRGPPFSIYQVVGNAATKGNNSNPREEVDTPLADHPIWGDGQNQHPT